jgi:hypothetical protein
MLADTTAAFLLDHSSAHHERGFDPDSGSQAPGQRNRLSRSA